MYPVSTAYKTQINKTLRNPSFIRVFLGVIEPDAIGANTMSSNGEIYNSDLQHIDENLAVEKKYHTFEWNRMLLDGVGLLAPDIGEPLTYFQGYVGSEKSDYNGYFTTNPKITINFSDYFNFKGLTFRFGYIYNTYPTDFRIIAYNDDVEVHNVLTHPNKTEWVYDTPIPATGLVNKIELIFERMFPVSRRAVLENITFGIYTEFTDQTITNANWNREIDLLSSKLPTNKFEFTSIDIEKIYNPDNPAGIWTYIEKRQPVNFQYGYQLDDGTIEWVVGGNLYTDGDIKVSSQGSISSVTFSARSYMNQMTDLYYKGIYDPTSNGGLGKSYYQLAVEAFTFAGLASNKYSIDSALQTMYTVLPIPEVPVNEALQLIANATRCVLYTDRNGIATIKRIPNPQTAQDFKFDFSNMKNIPNITKIPLLYSVDTFYSTVLAETSQSDLVSTDVSATVPTTIRITHDEAKNTTLGTTGITVISSEFYSKSTLVTFTGTGTITVKGKKLNRTKTSVLKVYTDTGYNCPIENPLIDKRDDAVAYADWVASVLLRRNSYEAEDRGYPELDVMDDILVDSLFTTDVQATVFSSKINYNGSLSGTTKYVTIEV